MSSYQKTQSLAVNGLPSDHFSPLRRYNVVVLPSSLTFQSRASEGMILLPAKSQNSGLSAERMRLMFSASAGPVNPRRHVPPYLPISFTGCTTSGSDGKRSLTAGNLPSFTSWASAGASLNAAGILAASVNTAGPSRVPIRFVPGAGAAVAARVAAEVAAAVAALVAAGGTGAVVGAAGVGLAGAAQAAAIRLVPVRADNCRNC